MAGQPVKGSPAIHLVLCYLLAILSFHLETILNYIPYSPAPVPGLSLDWLDMFPIIFAHFILLITLYSEAVSERDTNSLSKLLEGINGA